MICNHQLQALFDAALRSAEKTKRVFLRADHAATTQPGQKATADEPVKPPVPPSRQTHMTKPAAPPMSESFLQLLAKRPGRTSGTDER